MSEPSDIRQLINLWPTRAELAADLSVTCGKVNVGKVHKWAQASSIPSRFHAAVIQAAKSRGFNVSAELLVDLHSIKAFQPTSVPAVASEATP